ncbi:MAG: type II toxin-antitoxin system HicB family antitoxin [Acidobacteriota bacterium]|nr:type II toxin-antitoxin system HicB family antitoxin [Acidobacteriota bacterium]
MAETTHEASCEWREETTAILREDGMADASYYLSLPYATVLRRDEDGDVVATIAELDGCVAHGSDHAEALANLRDAQAAWVEAAIEAAQDIPLPEKAEACSTRDYVALEAERDALAAENARLIEHVSKVETARDVIYRTYQCVRDEDLALLRAVEAERDAMREAIRAWDEARTAPAQPPFSIARLEAKLKSIEDTEAALRAFLAPKETT